jgi:hypothetical protein
MTQAQEYPRAGEATRERQPLDEAGGPIGSTTAYTREQLAKLSFALFYSSNLCAPQNIAAVIKEIDTCEDNCEHVWGSTCRKEERGDFCPFSLAEDLRQISAALFGPPDPSGYIANVFGPDKVDALRAQPSGRAIDAAIGAGQPSQAERGLSTDEQKAQGERCGCRGVDDYCVCQNVPDAITRAERIEEHAREPRP